MSGKNTRKSLGKISKEDWYKHFQNLFKTTENINVPVELEIDAPDDEIEFLIFSSEITDDEILAAIKHLKVGKSAGPDNLIPEFFKRSIHIILPVLNKLFNRPFLNGYFPPCWSKSILVPLHKKGDINNTENYRGICLLDVLGKIFTSIINRRVTFFVNLYSKISEAQFGFREGYSTVDNAFILNSIIERYLAKKKGKIYVCFVDFKRAFDSVNREKLWAVLKTNGLKGTLMKVIKSMYEGVKTCVRVNGDYTDFFNCDEGLKQGCLLSPILFSMFVNEFTKIIETSGLRGIQLHPDLIEIFILLFADDIALISDTVGGLQSQLCLLHNFCKDKKITVHVGKTKVSVFRKGGRIKRIERWQYNGEALEVGFKYVGLLYTSKMSMFSMTEDLASKGKRVLVTLLNSLYDYGTMPKSIFFKLFDVKVLPMLLYGAEIWGVRQYECIERVQYYLCKRFMNVNLKASNYAVLGECGRYPLYIETTKRSIKYWLKVIHMPEHRYVKLCYKMLFHFDS